MSVYDLREVYADNMARAYGAGFDWEVLGMWHKTPPNYHFTKQGLPDKRYQNYPEVQAYWDAELENRARMIEATQAAPKSNVGEKNNDSL